MEDWKEKVSEDEFFCPMCGHTDTSDNWWTQQQITDMKKIASNWAMSYMQEEMDKSFKRLAKSTRNNKFMKVTYTPSRKITFQNNPLGQSAEWEREVICKNCITSYSVVGSAYFCPCCGHNAIEETFNESLDSIEKMIESLSEMEEFLSKSYGLDKAKTMCQTMLEGSIADVVSAFQKYAVVRFCELSSKSARPNDFQIIYKGSKLFLEETGKGYDSWLNEDELSYMNLMFQKRHVMEHSGGFVDEQYIEKSGDNSYTVGQRLIIRETDAINLVKVIRKLSIGIESLLIVDD